MPLKRHLIQRQTPSASRFEPKPYRPSNRVSGRFLGILLIGVLLTTVTSCNTGPGTTFTLSVDVVPEQAGSVEPSSGEFDQGEEVVIEVHPQEGWVFDRWEGDITGNENPLTLLMDSDKEMSAHFVERSYPLTVNIVGEGRVIETIIEQKIVAGYPAGVAVSLNAQPETDWDFIRWEGDLQGSQNPATVEMNTEKEITAVFEPRANHFLKTFGGRFYESGRSVIETADGGIVMAGYTWSSDGHFEGLNPGESSIFLIKTDEEGETQWVRVFGGSREDRAYSLIETNDGGLLVTGYTWSDDGLFSGLNHGQSSAYLLKLDDAGKKEWVRTYGGSSRDHSYSVTELPSGNLALTGTTRSSNGDFSDRSPGNSDIFLIIADPSGEIERIKTFGGSGNDAARSISSGEGGSLYITGTTQSGDGDFEHLQTSNQSDIFLIKTDEKGNREWIETFGGSDRDFGRSVTAAQGGGAIITGHTFSTDDLFSQANPGDSDIFVINVDPHGSRRWVRTYGGGQRDVAYHISSTQDGGALVAGATRSGLGGGALGVTNAYIFRLSSVGGLQWHRAFSGSEEDLGWGVTESDKGETLVTGSSMSDDGHFNRLNKGSADIVLIRFGADGNF